MRTAIDPQDREPSGAGLGPVGPDGTTASLRPPIAPDVELPPDPAIYEPIIRLGSPRRNAFRVGLVSRGDPADLVERLSPFRRALGETLGRSVEILPMDSFAALISAQMLKRVDLAFYSASALVTVQERCGCVEPLVAPVALDGTSAIHAVIVVRRDSGLKAVDDLRGRTISAASAESVGGRLFPVVSLIEEGVDPNRFFGEIRDAGTTTAAVKDVRDGVADAAFAWTSLSGSEETGYSRGTLAYLVAGGEIAMDDFAIIWQSPPLTHGPVAVRAGMEQGEKALLEAFLTSLSDRDPESYEVLDPYYGGGYRPVAAADYAAARLLVRHSVAPAAAGDQEPPQARPSAIELIETPTRAPAGTIPSSGGGIIVE